MKKNSVYIFLDIDGVLAPSSQYFINPKRWHPIHNCYRFDKKCIKVFKSLVNEIEDFIIVLSSDWRNDYSIDEMNEIFIWNDINIKISDYTSSHWGHLIIEYDDNGEQTNEYVFNTTEHVSHCRAFEINQYVKKHNIKSYIVIDDLDLSEWIDDDVYVKTKEHQGIKESNIKEKILIKIKNQK